LTSGAGILLYLPIRIAFHAPSGFDSIGDGFGIVFEFMMIGGFLAIVHIASLAAMGLLIVETLLERRKSRVSNEVSSDN
jgi:hypothetical protein